MRFPWPALSPIPRLCGHQPAREHASAIIIIIITITITIIIVLSLTRPTHVSAGESIAPAPSERAKSRKTGNRYSRREATGDVLVTAGSPIWQGQRHFGHLFGQE